VSAPTAPSSIRNPPAVALTDVGRRFAGFTALEEITLDVPAGRFVAMVGPSGCGKSTVLNLIAGLIAPTRGTISIFGEPLRGLNRRAAYMFQQDALLPWKTVLDNIRLGLDLRGRSAAEARSEAARWVARVGLEGFADRYPYQLSGGMRKRVAMAQAWIVQPDLLLMDEPFSALDVHTRLLMESELLSLWADSHQTVIFVTHDLEEAISLADEVFVLAAGPASRVVGRYLVDLERPRDLIDIRLDRRFQELYENIWSDLRKEVLRSQGRPTFANPDGRGAGPQS
jgi:NitT/TauT family transport system ATP-binding protein